MNSNTINPVFVLTLAIIPLISVAKTLNEIVFLGLLVGLTYIIAISLVSILEKLVDRNLRFFVFILIASVIVMALNFIFSTFPNSLYSDAGSKINYCLISASILSLQIIYYDQKRELTNYFFKLLIQVPSFLLYYSIFGVLREIIAYGSIWKFDLGFSGLEFFRSTAGALLLLAFMCSFINAYWLHASAKKQQYNLLVEKYKMKISVMRNDERVNIVNNSELKNFGASEFYDDKLINERVKQIQQQNEEGNQDE